MSATALNSKTAPVLILDGGLGTTLEDVFHQDISTPLWSAKPIEEDPEVIISTHLAFLRAGSDIILTSTYQCAFNTFERSGYSRQDAERIMLKSVRLAVEAKRRFLSENHMQADGAPRGARIALSLGPYGATLSPAQEFDGFYPPPFGPSSPSDVSVEKTNAFTDTDDERAKERAAVDALAAFHLERLRVFANDAEVWGALDFVAFETVPLRREVFAIRRAMAQLQVEKGTEHMKPWWISTVHPDGHYPEMKPGGGWVSTTEVAEAVLFGEGDGIGASPWAFGINCTSLEFLPVLLKDAEGVAERFFEQQGQRPWLAMYPNRGDVYIPETQSWRKVGREGELWAKDFGEIVRQYTSGVWGGIVIGGCCKTGPDEIAGLKKHLA